MKKLIALTLMGLSGAASNYAFSSDGVVQFSGHLSEESCNLSVNGSGTSEGTVIIPSVNFSDLTNTNNAERTEFTIAMKDCNTNSNIRPHFESHADGNGYLPNTTRPEDGGAKLIRLAIYNEEGDRLNITNYIPEDQIPFKPSQGSDEVVFNYAVSIIGTTDTGSVGRVTGALTYSVEYQ